jgi:hypothetical protein
MDGLDIVRIHWTQEHPEAPLKMEILNYGEVPFHGPLKGMRSREAEKLVGSVWRSSNGGKPDRVMRLIRHNKTSPEEISIVNIQVCIIHFLPT